MNRWSNYRQHFGTFEKLPFPNAKARNVAIRREAQRHASNACVVWLYSQTQDIHKLNNEILEPCILHQHVDNDCLIAACTDSLYRIAPRFRLGCHANAFEFLNWCRQNSLHSAMQTKRVISRKLILNCYSVHCLDQPQQHVHILLYELKVSA